MSASNQERRVRARAARMGMRIRKESWDPNDYYGPGSEGYMVSRPAATPDELAVGPVVYVPLTVARGVACHRAPAYARRGRVVLEGRRMKVDEDNAIEVVEAVREFFIELAHTTVVTVNGTTSPELTAERRGGSRTWSGSSRASSRTRAGS